MSPGTLLVRADANIGLGTGHVMRCLALAQAWQDRGGKVLSAMAESTPAIEGKLARENVEVLHVNARPGSVEDANATADLAHREQASWVVLDGYRFGADYQEIVRRQESRLLLIDDGMGEKAYCANLILNQNVHACAEPYAERARGAGLLLGPRYAMLRRQFVGWREWKREFPNPASRVLVTMGGSDPDNFTLRVIEALQILEHQWLEVTLVVGGSNPHADTLEKAASKLPHARLLRDIENMPEIMAGADVAISAAGTTCWEMCLLGLPALVVDLAPNQLPVARWLYELGVARHLGSSHLCHPDRIVSELERLLPDGKLRRQMSQAGRSLVDGRGAARVCATMLASEVRLRPATPSDCRQLWMWANEPQARISSFSQRQIDWEEHCEWFKRKLGDGKCLILIAENAQSVPIGQIRFDEQPSGEADIDVSVAPESRGAGYGTSLIKAAVEEFFATSTATAVNAYIRPENNSSLRAFEKAGFIRVGEQQLRGNRTMHYCRKKEVQKVLFRMQNRAVQAELLEERIAENRASQSIDLAQWIFERVHINDSDQILELCCGTGGQTLSMLERLGDKGNLLALDLSSEALQTLTAKVPAQDCHKLATLCASLDEVSTALESKGLERPAFDLVFCAYGLYYSQYPEKTLQQVREWLKPHGRIVVVGPFGPNNKPLFDLLEEAGVRLTEAVTSSSSQFMVETVVPWAALHFESMRINTMVNPVRWATPERALNYWQNTTFYDESRRLSVQALLQRHLSEHREFVNQKWVMMVEMRNARS